MKIVAVTSCPVGMAHTYIASAALKDAAEKEGIDIKVETQGMSGIMNRITEADLQEADAAILTTDVVIEENERFMGMPTYQTSTSRLIKESGVVIKETIELINIQKRSDS